MKKENIQILEDNLNNIPVFFLYRNLNKVEKLTISKVYWSNWRVCVKRSKLNRVVQNNFKLHFKELHAMYYTKVLKGPNFVSVYRLILNFFISRTNENLRTCLNSFEPYNLTSFILAIRSQIELNALLLKFIDDEDYLKKFITLNDNRALKELETVININTLVKKLDKYAKKNTEFVGYEETYNDLSLLLHPNPSAVRFYAQAFKENDSDTSIPSPSLSHFFDNTIDKTEHTNTWFENYTVLFLSFVFHFISMVNDLPSKDFYINEKEEDEMIHVAKITYLVAHKKNLLRVVNKACKDGVDIETALKNYFSSDDKK